MRGQICSETFDFLRYAGSGLVNFVVKYRNVKYGIFEFDNCDFHKPEMILVILQEAYIDLCTQKERCTIARTKYSDEII